MMNQEPSDLTTRLERLERHNRYYKCAGCLVLVAVAIGAVRRPDVPKAIEAESFVLLDARGRTRALLGTMPEAIGGHPSLALFDESGFSDCSLYGTGLSFDVSPKAKGEHPRRATIGSTPDGAYSFRLWSRDGVPRVDMSVDKDGNPSLGLIDKTENYRLHASLGPDGLPSLSMYDDKARRIAVGVSKHENSPGRLDLSDRDGKIRASISVGADGTSSVEVFDKDGQVVTRIPKRE